MNQQDAYSGAWLERIRPFWRARAREMVAGVTAPLGCTTPITDVRVCKDWPLRGSLRFTRVDGQRFKVRHLKGRGNKPGIFRTEVVG